LLSYRHAFHAGNFADVLKHSVLTLTLEYMTRKEKGFSYIDSHSGAGMYQLKEEYAQKTGEYKNGIAKLLDRTDLPESLQDYIGEVKSINQDGELNYYPGSPGFARNFLRRQDSAHLYELHSTDIEYLTTFCERWKKARVNQSDGYKGVLGNLPPATRRAVVLIDPPYELKEDYIKAVTTIIEGYKRFSSGTYILWYPVVTRNHINGMQQQFLNSKTKNILQVEFNVMPDTDTYGMTGTGLFIVNPPWQLMEQLHEMLPYLNTTLGSKDSSYLLKQLVEE
jgi:23S rRNA (adenine2030-N6)-methyltransferase